METIKATLDGTTYTADIDKDALFFVDWENLKGVEDLVLIFACMGLSFSGRHPHFETIKHLLDLSNPIKPNGVVPPQPKAENLNMPKLKTIK